MIILIAFVILFSPATLYAGDGKVLFDQYCRACHGEGGVSHSRSFPSLKSTNMPAAQIKAVIRNGLNSGSGTEMPAIRELDRNQIDRIVDYIEGLRAVSFKRDVFPVFQQYCLSCHRQGGNGYRTSGFSVESYQDILAGTSFGAIITPGSSVGSTLMMLIEHKVDSSIHMPFRKEKLPQQKIDILRKWIDQGAKNN